MECASEPGGIAAGAGALPGARRRCEAGKRTHGPGPLACLALLALPAPAQAQTEIWSATLTPGDLGGGILGCSNGVSHARCSNTSFLSEDSFNHDSTDYNIAGLFVRSNGRLEFSVLADITTATAALTLVVGSTSLVLADATTINTRSRYWSSSGVSLTAGTDITVKLTAPGTPNTAPTGAPTITGTAQVGQTLTAVTTGIMDADGLTSPTYTYQWIRVDGTEADIAGENSSTYTLVDADRRRTNEKDDFRVRGRHHADGGIRPGAGRRLVGHFHTSPTYTYQWIRVDGTEADIAISMDTRSVAEMATMTLSAATKTSSLTTPSRSVRSSTQSPSSTRLVEPTGSTLQASEPQKTAHPGSI